MPERPTGARRGAWRTPVSIVAGIGLALLYGCVVYVGAQRTPLLFDDALNWLVALNLRDHFAYIGRYQPARIYDPAMTTNGPLQYLAAGALAVLPLDDARSLVLAVVAATLCLAVFLLSRWAVLLLITLTFAWPILWYALTLFLGEVTATAMLLFGVTASAAGAAVVRRSGATSMACVWRVSWRTRAFWLAGVLFGVAIATKLLVVLIVPLICLPVLATGLVTDASPWSGLRRRTLLTATAITGAITLVALVFFTIQAAASVAHSLVALQDGRLGWVEVRAVPEALAQFVIGHARVGRQNATTMIAAAPPSLLRLFSSPAVALLAAGAAAVLIVRSLTYLPLLGLLLVLAATPDANERRLLPLLFVLVFLGAAIVIGDSPLGAVPCWTGAGWRRGRPALVGLALAAGVALASRVGPTTSTAWAVLAADHATMVQQARTRLDYTHVHASAIDMTRLVEIVQSRDEVIVTSGWWQFPEVAVRSGVTFYDRMALPNQSLRERPGGVLLLFDEALKTWPETDTRLCAGEIYRQGTLVLCRFAPGYPLNERALP